MRNALNSIVKIHLKRKVNQILLFSSLVLLLLGCQDVKYPEKPKDLIPEDKMVEILIDVHLFNAGKSVNRLPLQKTGRTPFELIYEKHNIDSLQYEKSNAYYGAYLNKYERIHLKVKDSLESKKAEIDTLKAREMRKKVSTKTDTDSIKSQAIEGKAIPPRDSEILKKPALDTLK